MNDLEVGCRGVLTTMIQGASCEVDFATSCLLASWAAKTCLMAQFTHPESVATPPSYFEWLFVTGKPPPNMRIWVLPIAAADWGIRMEHRGVLWADSEATPISDPCNTHSTTIGLGQMLLFILGTTSSTLFSDEISRVMPTIGAQLWPRPNSFAWSSDRCLSDDDVWQLADLLPELIGS
jgi:hypothetical protein